MSLNSNINVTNRPKSFFRRLLVAGSVGAILLLATGCSSNESDSAQDSDTAPLLFTLTSDGSRIKAGAGDSDGYQLLLDHVDDHSVWFTDRPDRSSGVFRTSNLVAGWEAFGFTETPPNVALITHSATGASETAVVTLTNPQFDTRYRVFMADITFVDKPQKFMPERGTEVDLGQMSLFIDDAEVQLPTDSPDSGDQSQLWSYHAIIPNPDEKGKYIQKWKDDKSPLDPGENVIYSIPAVDLIENYNDAHLDLIKGGVDLPKVSVPTN